MTQRRRWTVRLDNGQVLVIQVSRKTTHISVSTDRIRVDLSPETVARIRNAYGEALAVRLQDRGRW